MMERTKTMPCDHCGTETPMGELDAKPSWVRMAEWRWSLWRIDGIVRFARLAMLEEAAWEGDTFDRLECGACFGPGFDPPLKGRFGIRVRVRAWWRRYQRWSDRLDAEMAADATNGIPNHMVW